jgi:HAD superfamily hydrolase (TIGR01662 family)
MCAKHGQSWRPLIVTTPVRTGRHLLTTAAALIAVAAVAAGRFSRAERPQGFARRHSAGAAAAAGLVWAGLASEFALGRILAGPRTAREISAMVVTSALIPPVAVAHRVRGDLQVRLAGRSALRVSDKPRAVLCDRDGTLIRDVPYLADPRRVHPMPGVCRTLNRLHRQGVAVGVVSNQSGVARGLIHPDQLAMVNARVESLLGPFDTWQVCPHSPDAGCSCRKPEPGLVTAAALELRLAPRNAS